VPAIQSAPALLREARHRAGLTQVQLAARADTTQSVISAYESGRRQPTLPVLLRLLAATGHSLEGSLVAGAPTPPAALGGPLGRRVRRYRQEIIDVAGRHGATNVRIFGSVARGTEGAGSDIDVLVDLPPGTGLFALGRLRRDLHDLLGARVDVVPAEGLKPDVHARVGSDLVAL
jgi:uncharacterized protein